MTNSDHNFKENQLIQRPRQTRSVTRTDKKGREVYPNADDNECMMKVMLLQDLQSAIIIIRWNTYFGFGPNLKPCFFSFFKFVKVRLDPTVHKSWNYYFHGFYQKTHLNVFLDWCGTPTYMSRLSIGGRVLLNQLMGYLSTFYLNKIIEFSIKQKRLHFHRTQLNKPHKMPSISIMSINRPNLMYC